MCGIAGYAGWPATPEESERRLKAMCGAIRHRGPDDEGHYIAENVALGMRRLSIIDLEGGSQPIANEDGSVNVVFNGEIYNYRSLRDGLIRSGHRFSTQSDTETLVHLYEDQGENLVHELNGMFGFAVWDARKRSLLVARDRLGIKPVFYWETRGGVAFASELKSLLQLKSFEPTLDPVAIAYYMALGYVPDPLTVFRGVKKLPPGHFFTWDPDRGVQIERYWDPATIPEALVTEEAAVEELRELVSDAVRIRLIADVPLGAFLSSGTDSSAVVALMARHSTLPVRTFSIGFQEGEYNEAVYAAELARELATEHTELTVRPDADELVEGLVSSFGEPFADSSAIPTYLVSRLASEQVKVALSGDGGDELFGGYTRYLRNHRPGRISPAPLRSLLGFAGRHLPHGTYGKNHILNLSRSKRGRYAATVSFPLSPRDGGVGKEGFSRLIPAMDHLLDPWFDRVSHRDHESQVALVDLMSYLPGDILTKVDRMSMACSLEARVPLLDHRLVEFAMSLPGSLKIRHGKGKWIFREAISEFLPQKVLNRPKRGFAVPLNRWFRKELRHRVEGIMDRNSPMFDFLDYRSCLRVVEEHQRERRDHKGILWRILVLKLWLDGLREAPKNC